MGATFNLGSSSEAPMLAITVSRWHAAGARVVDKLLSVRSSVRKEGESQYLARLVIRIVKTSCNSELHICPPGRTDCVIFKGNEKQLEAVSIL